MGHELARRHQPALGMEPPQQRLGTGDRTPCKVELRLVVQHELAPLQCLAQLASGSLAGADLGIHRRLEEAEPAAPLGLGAIEGKVGVLQEVMGVAAIIGEERYAEAGRDVGFLPTQVEG